MRAITLTQPRATLVAIGAKRIETRSWSTSYRGPLAIHAAKGWTAVDHDFVESPVVQAALNAANATGTGPGDLPRGSIIAVVKLSGTRRTVGHRFSEPTFEGDEAIPEAELVFGNYEPGRFGWFLDDARMLPEPIPCRGYLGLWETPSDVDERLRTFLLDSTDVELAELQTRVENVRLEADRRGNIVGEADELEQRIAEAQAQPVSSPPPGGNTCSGGTMTLDWLSFVFGAAVMAFGWVCSAVAKASPKERPPALLRQPDPDKPQPKPIGGTDNLRKIEYGP